jgi:hypothetical protein
MSSNATCAEFWLEINNETNAPIRGQHPKMDTIYTGLHR